MEKFELRVAEAKQRDVGRSIVRIDGDTMKQLNIRTGDIVAITGKRTTAAISWPAFPEDKGRGIIRMDGRLRKCRCQVGGKNNNRKSQ